VVKITQLLAKTPIIQGFVLSQTVPGLLIKLDNLDAKVFDSKILIEEIQKVWILLCDIDIESFNLFEKLKVFSALVHFIHITFEHMHPLYFLQNIVPLKEELVRRRNIEQLIDHLQDMVN
jgi:hypothetical protein